MNKACQQVSSFWSCFGGVIDKTRHSLFIECEFWNNCQSLILAIMQAILLCLLWDFSICIPNFHASCSSLICFSLFKVSSRITVSPVAQVKHNTVNWSPYYSQTHQLHSLLCFQVQLVSKTSICFHSRVCLYLIINKKEIVWMPKLIFSVKTEC